VAGAVWVKILRELAREIAEFERTFGARGE